MRVGKGYEGSGLLLSLSVIYSYLMPQRRVEECTWSPDAWGKAVVLLSQPWAGSAVVNGRLEQFFAPYRVLCVEGLHAVRESSAPEIEIDHCLFSTSDGV